MKTVNEFCVSNGAQRLSVRLQTKWLWNRFLLQVLKPQNCACFDQGASWHSGNYRVYIHFKTCMWHDKNTIKKFIAGLLWFYKIISFTAELRHLRFSMVAQLQSHLLRIGSKWFLLIWSEKSLLSFALFLLGSKNKSREKLCLPNWFTINIPHCYWINL